MTTVATFRTTRRFVAPRWLTEGDGGLVGYALDLIKDAFVERVRLGLHARLPGGTVLGRTAPTAPADALIAMGRDRRVVRGIFETSEEYAVRLRAWLDDQPQRGNPYALMRKLAEYTGPGPAFRTVDVRGNWYSRAADGTETALLAQGNWDWDGDVSGTRWSRFWAIIYPLGLWDEGTQEWGDPSAQNWGEIGLQNTWGTSAPPEHVQTIRSIVSEWMPGGTRCVNIIIALDPASFDPTSPEPDGTWARWSKEVGGVRVAARLNTARYWDGV